MSLLGNGSLFQYLDGSGDTTGTTTAITVLIVAVLVSYGYSIVFALPGMMTSIVPKTRLLSLITDQIGIRGLNDAPLGLRNYANTCFMNSVLQSLASVEPMVEFLTKLSKDNKVKVLTALKYNQEELRQTRAQQQRAYGEPMELIISLVQKEDERQSFIYDQQDADEFFQLLMNALDEEINKVNRRHIDGFEGMTALERMPSYPMLPKHPFIGLTSQTITCDSCGFTEGRNYETFKSLFLTIPQQPGRVSLEDCIGESFDERQALENVECLKCSTIAYCNHLKNFISKATDETVVNAFNAKLRTAEQVLELADYSHFNLPSSCKIKRSKTKKGRIARTPLVLVTHINRSVMNPYGAITKTNCPIIFPLHLDLSPWLEDADCPRAQFKLKSFVVHYGSHSNGHYVCFRSFGKQWWRLSDRNVRAASLEEIEGETGGVLGFYERQ